MAGHLRSRTTYLLFGLLGCTEPLPPPPPPPAANGELSIAVTTSGNLIDRDGYRINVDDTLPLQVDVNSVTVLAAAPGRHVVTLSDIASQCHGEGPSSLTAFVAQGHRSGVAFQVDCAARGGLVVKTETVGTDTDPDGYILVLNGQLSSYLAQNSELRLDQLSKGVWQVTLRGVAGNCSASDGIDRAVVLDPDVADARIEFHVRCGARITATPGDYLVVARGSPDQGLYDEDLYLTKLGSTASERLTDHPWEDYAPSLSPDGSRVVFLRRYSGGGGVPTAIMFDRSTRREQELPIHGYEPLHWSPDGRRLVFVENGHLTVVDPSDAARKVVLREGAYGEAYWSPDGSRIAYSRLVTTGFNAVITLADGTGAETTLPSDARFAGPWSPDGKRLALRVLKTDKCYQYYYYYSYPCWTAMGLASFDVATSHEDELLAPVDPEDPYPVWSAAGDQVFYHATIDGNPNVFAKPLGPGPTVQVSRTADRILWFTLGRLR